MKTRIAKEFKWEMSHRLPFHDGLCKNLHGHSYKMVVILEGEPNASGMIMDFYDIETAVRPLLDKLDHAFLCSEGDKKLIGFLKEYGFKYATMPNYTTAEYMAQHFIGEIKGSFAKHDNIEMLAIRIYETIDAYAEVSLKLKDEDK